MDRFASSCDLKRGLLKLGIGVSNKVADTLLRELGGTIHFTAHDLASFTQHVGNCQNHVRSSARRTKASAGENSATCGPPSFQREFSVDEQKDEAIVRPHSNEGERGALEPGILTPRHDGREQGVPCSDEVGRTDDDTVPQLVLGARSRPQDHATKFPWDDLPCWARESSKNALHELLGHHQR